MQKSEFDLLAYSLYGSGDALEESVCSLLTQIGLQVERQSTGANIDLKAKHHALSLGFAIEVTGTKGTIQKDSNKIAQAWQYLKDREGTSEEDDRLMIVANTEIHLEPLNRAKPSYSQPVIRLLGANKVLLITTLQLYDLWKSVRGGLVCLNSAARLISGIALPCVRPPRTRQALCQRTGPASFPKARMGRPAL